MEWLGGFDGNCDCLWIGVGGSSTAHIDSYAFNIASSPETNIPI